LEFLGQALPIHGAALTFLAEKPGTGTCEKIDFLELGEKGDGLN